MRSIWIVTLVFVGLSVYYDMGFWLMQPPSSVHVWRQSDCASYALNYYQNDRSLFSPQVHHRHAVDGNTISEFPIIYYATSYLYRIFGVHDYFIRWIGYLIFYLSLVSVTMMSRYFIQNNYIATIPPILMMMSCVLVYYATNFLPDVPALCFALIGFYFFIRYIFHFKNMDFVVAILFSTLASLLKISSALLFVCIILYTCYYKFIKKENRFTRANIFLQFSGVFVIVCWLLFVRVYNDLGQYYGNLQGTMGIWLCDKTKILYIIKRTFEEWIPALGSRKLWILFFPAIIYVLYQWKHVHQSLKFILPLLLSGCVFYIVAWFGVFDVHDYYFINIFCFPILLSIAVLSVLEKSLDNKRLKIFMVLAVILFGMTAEDTSAQFYNRKYHTGWNAIPNKAFYTITPYLRSLGIDRYQLIYSPSDPSTNITLYLSNNPGWTKIFGTTAEDVISRGAKFMLIEENLLDTEEFLRYKEKSIGKYKDIVVIQF